MNSLIYEIVENALLKAPTQDKLAEAIDYFVEINDIFNNEDFFRLDKICKSRTHKFIINEHYIGSN